MTELNGQTVFVFGASGALGGGLAAAFAASGARVLGLARTVPAPQQRREGVDYRAIDVLDDTALGALFDDEPVPWAVVNTVGGFAPSAPLNALDEAELTEQLALNLTTAALITKHALRRFTQRGTGRLVHTASRSALESKGSGFAYSVSKLGVLHLVEMAAREAHGSAVTVNAVVPSIVDTPANRAAMPKAQHDRWPSIEDIAPVYEFLISPAAALVSGAVVPVYGLS